MRSLWSEQHETGYAMAEEADASGDLEMVELVVGRAQLYVDDQKNSDSLLHWKHDVEKQEVRSALQRPKFVRRLVDRIMQVCSALSALCLRGKSGP